MCSKQPIVVKYTALIFHLNSDGSGGDVDGDSYVPIQEEEMQEETEPSQSAEATDTKVNIATMFTSCASPI